MWTLVSPSPAQQLGSNEYVLPNEGVAHIVLDENSNHAQVVRSIDSRVQRELGRIVAGSFGVKLEAINEKLAITPGQAHAASLLNARFELQPRSDNQSEAIFLRHGDMIHLPSSKSNLTCQWTDSEVQVNSSAAPDARAVAATPDDETEDEDLNEPAAIARNQKTHPRATPQLVHQQSLVIQETPTVARVNNASNSMTADINPPDFTNNVKEPVNDTPIQSREPEAESEPVPETFSTARTSESQDKTLATSKAQQNANIPPSADDPMTGVVASKDMSSLRTPSKGSPQVQIPPRSTRKRSTSAVEDVPRSESEALTGPTKRTKTSNDEDSQSSRTSSIEVKSQGSARKRKQRMTDVAATEAEEDFTRSPQSSGQSTSTTTEAYDGPPPRVASSNSTITKSSQAVKLLKQKGGAYVEKLTDNFNVLCVRDGDLQKKTKVLYAIACGIPIVTDTWLLDSAKKGRLLPLSAYKPSISKQEEQWKFTFDDIFGKPQTPFEGYTIHFTKSLKDVYESFSEVTAVCKAAGAKNVTSTRMNTTGDNIVLANSYEKDPEAQKLIKDGITCYTKDLFTYSIFRGFLDLESDEFKIKGPASDGTSSKESKKRGRKST